MTSVTYQCQGCGAKTTLDEVATVPADGLCPPCHFWGLDWVDDPALVEILDAIQAARVAH